MQGIVKANQNPNQAFPFIFATENKAPHLNLQSQPPHPPLNATQGCTCAGEISPEESLRIVHSSTQLFTTQMEVKRERRKGDSGTFMKLFLLTVELRSETAE